MEPLLGSLLLFAGNFAPRGWMFCNGQLLPISQNTALFSILGTTYGGNGQTTFGLPDLRGRAPISFGQGPGLSNYDLGQSGGAESVTLLVSNIPSHNHSLLGDAGNGAPSPQGNVLGSPTANIYDAKGQPNLALNAASIGMTGGGQPVSIMQPYLTLTWIIAVEGVFPSRP
jgi:microcystin-dependent protein